MPSPFHHLSRWTAARCRSVQCHEPLRRVCYGVSGAHSGKEARAMSEQTNGSIGARGRVTLITGASRGLGFALAQALAQDGWSLIIDARGAEDLKAAQQRL